MTTPPATRAALPAPQWLWFLPPFTLGVFLRFFRLGAQLLGGDELNAVQRAFELTVPKALTTYHLSDNCLPLTALYRFLLDWGCPPTELLFRAPSLIAGVVLAVAAPLALARRVTPAVGLAAAWLLALSPVLTLYSRIARPYEALALTAFGAALAFDAWWRRGSLAAAGAFVGLATLTAYLHLGAAPFVVAPFLLAGALALGQRGHEDLERRSLAQVLGLGAATLVGC